MSFICDKCKKTSIDGERMNKVAVKKIPRKYYHLELKKKKTKEKIILYKKPTEKEMEGYKKSQYEVQREWWTDGWEIAKENKLCGGCYEKVRNKEEQKTPKTIKTVLA